MEHSGRGIARRLTKTYGKGRLRRRLGIKVWDMDGQKERLDVQVDG